jgi:site-specific DNA-methyltransferase (cytosine-N4-specific)
MYTTPLGAAYVGDSRHLLAQLPPCSVDLAITSPPFALLRQKAYGNQDQSVYVDWLVDFCRLVFRVLKPTGSFVLDLGGAYEKGRPVRSLYNFRVPIRLCDDLGFRLAEDFYWYNPARLPSPIEWVNKRKIRAKDSVDIVYWFSKEDEPKADVRRVLTPYSDRMKKLLEDPAKFYSPKKRPSGHDIGSRFSSTNGGAIPSNLLQIPNTESNSPYLRFCKGTDTPGHPARFPEKLPRFFIDFLTEPGDLVLDFFAGSNTTGAAAEQAHRRWLAFEFDAAYLAASAFRFIPDTTDPTAAGLLRDRLMASPTGGEHIHHAPSQPRPSARRRARQRPAGNARLF